MRRWLRWFYARFWWYYRLPKAVRVRVCPPESPLRPTKAECIRIGRLVAYSEMAEVAAGRGDKGAERELAQLSVGLIGEPK